MAKTDRLKEEIAWLKLFSGGGIALIVSLVGWLVRNYEAENLIVTAAAITIALVVAIAVVAAVARLYRCFKLLEES